MSLARAFTKRIRKDSDGNITLSRGHTVKNSISRNMISLPTELISTTNSQAYSAPDIRDIRDSRRITPSTTSSDDSGPDSDFSHVDRDFRAGHESTDNSSVDLSSPGTPLTPPMTATKDFFEIKAVETEPEIVTSLPTPDIPAVPKRAPSHSKRAHVELSRKRSVQRMTPPPETIEHAAIRTSAEIFGGASEESHPFGRELAKVNEVAEEFGVRSSFVDAEEQELINKGLCKFTVEDYIEEIAGMYRGVFDDYLGPMANPWI